MFERTYNGIAWETVDETEVRRILSGYYADVDMVIEQMKLVPDFEARSFGAYYRYREPSWQVR